MQRSWYYSKDRTERQGPVSTEQLRALIRQGTVSPDTLVWAEGMTDWITASATPELRSPELPATAPQAEPTEAASPVLVPPNLGAWLRFVGIMSILMGVVYCASCFGILWGVLLIVGGVALLGARSALEQITEVPAAFIPFLDRLNTFFLVTGIAYIIMLVGTALVFVFYGGLMIAALSNLQR